MSRGARVRQRNTRDARNHREKVEVFAYVRDLRRRASLQVSATSFGLTRTPW
jgi:hypothetical protein